MNKVIKNLTKFCAISAVCGVTGCYTVARPGLVYTAPVAPAPVVATPVVTTPVITTPVVAPVIAPAWGWGWGWGPHFHRPHGGPHHR